MVTKDQIKLDIQNLLDTYPKHKVPCETSLVDENDVYHEHVSGHKHKIEIKDYHAFTHVDKTFIELSIYEDLNIVGLHFVYQENNCPPSYQPIIYEKDIKDIKLHELINDIYKYVIRSFE